MINKKEFFIFLLVIVLSFFTILPLFNSGFFPVHDDEQIGRLYDLDQALRAGHIPPRLVPNLGFGYGYPFFNFYPPLAYYIAEVFVLIGFSYILSIKIMIGLGFILAALFMYMLSRELFGKLGGLVAAIAYSYAPYHAVDVYVRGALPEFWAFVFLPAIFWAILRLKIYLSFRYTIILGIFIACLILTHNLIFIMSLPFIAAFVLFLTFQTKSDKKFVLLSGISISIGLGLSAYFWLPSFLEKQYTMIDLLTTELANYGLHFVSLRQFWDSPWGYGGSILGPYDGISFQVGKVSLVLSMLIPFVAFFSFQKSKKVNFAMLLFYVFFAFALFMSTRYSKFIWDNIQPLWYIQFPWRFLLLSAFASSVLLGSIFAWPGLFKNAYRIPIAILIVASIILLQKNYFAPQSYLNVGDNYYTNTEKLRWDTSKLAAEYVPKGIATRKTDINTTVVDINQQSIAKTSFEILSGDLKVQDIKNVPQEKSFNINAKTNGILQINIYSFPGWKIFLDGKEVGFSDDNKLKLMVVAIPSGVHYLQALFTNTPIRTIANALSVVTILLITFFAITRRYFSLPKL